MDIERARLAAEQLLLAEIAWSSAGGDPGAVAEAALPSIRAGFAAMREVSQRGRRRLFRVELHPPDLAVAWVSEASGLADGFGKYELRLWVRSADVGPEVARVDHVCTACVALGIGPDGKACLECGGAGWEPWFGEADLMGLRLGSPTQILVIEAPTSSLYLPEHHRSVAAARRAGLLPPRVDT